MSNKELIVVALGGNAITQPDEEGNVGEQFDNSRDAARPLAELVEKGYRLVVTHGNGPQIGNFLLRNDAAAGLIYRLPMEVAVAHVQGGMGYMIAQTLTNELTRRGHDRLVTAIMTTVLVDQDDPSFDHPTKPIGRVLSKEDADDLIRKMGWTIHEVSPGKWRRVVASPMPRRIMEMDMIKRAVQAGDLLVACGGGGIPVVRDSSGDLCGVRAVVDKDLASALLATEVGADAMLILTNVERVSINYGQPDETPIEEMSLSQARLWFDEGQFPPGSMGPKMLAAIQFLEATDNSAARVVIAPLDRAIDALAGRVGTCITQDKQFF